MIIFDPLRRPCRRRGEHTNDRALGDRQSSIRRWTLVLLASGKAVPVSALKPGGKVLIGFRRRSPLTTPVVEPATELPCKSRSPEKISSNISHNTSAATMACQTLRSQFRTLRSTS